MKKLATQHLKNEDHGIWSHHFMTNGRRKRWKQDRFLFSCTSKSLRMMTTAMALAPWKESYDLDSILKNRDINLPTKALVVKAMVFPVLMYGSESWIIKKAE